MTSLNGLFCNWNNRSQIKSEVVVNEKGATAVNDKPLSTQHKDMKNNEDYKYIIFPLPLLQEIFKKPKTGFSDIFYYGIYKSAESQDVIEYNAIKQALYCYYRGGITNSLKRKFDHLANDEIFTPDEDYSGFSGDEFNPEDEIESIYQYLKEDELMKNEIIEFHRLRQVKEILNITFDINTAIKIYQELQNEYDFSNVPFVMMNKEIMIEYSHKQKSEFEKVLFATYAGIKSIIGNKKFCQTTQDMIFMRMVGAKNNDALIEIIKDKKVKGIYNKYTVRYQKEKILDNLLARNFLSSKVGINKRTYLSCSLTHDELSEEIIRFFDENNIKSKIKSNKISELKAKNKILQHLNKSTSSTTLTTTLSTTS